MSSMTHSESFRRNLLSNRVGLLFGVRAGLSFKRLVEAVSRQPEGERVYFSALTLLGCNEAPRGQFVEGLRGSGWWYAR